MEIGCLDLMHQSRIELDYKTNLERYTPLDPDTEPHSVVIYRVSKPDN